jgi:hypothetical protein
MDFNATIDLIIKDLNEAREIIDDLKKYPGVPVLQVELAKSKCKSAAEVVALIKTLDDTLPLAREITSPIVPKLQTELKPLPQIQPQPQPQPKPKPQPKSQNKLQPKLKTPESPIIADKFSHLSNRFNEQLGSMKSENDVKNILKTKQLSNLTDAIGVNDRFLYIREIFDGNKDAYHLAITRLDSVESMDDARAVIMSFTGDNDENEAVKQLLDLVKRKLSSNE